MYAVWTALASLPRKNMASKYYAVSVDWGEARWATRCAGRGKICWISIAGGLGKIAIEDEGEQLLVEGSTGSLDQSGGCVIADSDMLLELDWGGQVIRRVCALMSFGSCCSRPKIIKIACINHAFWRWCWCLWKIGVQKSCWCIQGVYWCIPNT